jgi:UDP-glucose 4-epimerase
MKIRSIAVTGGNGGLGHAVVKDLSRTADVTALDIRPGAPGVNSRYCDVSHLQSLMAALQGHDAVVHAAGMLQPDDPPEEMFRINVMGAWNVLHAAQELGIGKVVLISSECASGIINISRVRQVPPDYLPIDEAHRLQPVDTYGLTKQVCEVAAQAFARRGRTQVVVLRPMLILMPGMEAFTARTREIDDPDLWSYVELGDVVSAARLALAYEGAAFDCFYISAPDTFSREETLAFMGRKFGGLPEIRNARLYQENPHAAIWDLTRSREVLGLEPASDWRKFIAGAKDTAPPPGGNQRRI